jgi:hypothetical protein
MRPHILYLLLFPCLAQAAPFLVSPPCATGAPLPTECRWTIGAAATVSRPPYNDAAGKVRCAFDLSGLTGTVTWAITPANIWGAATAASGAVDMTLLRQPDPFPAAGFTVVPALP